MKIILLKGLYTLITGNVKIILLKGLYTLITGKHEDYLI